MLAWIVSGARDFYATGTPAPLPAAVLALKAHIFREQDEFAEFLDDNTVADQTGSITRQDLRRLAEAYFGPMNRAAGNETFGGDEGAALPGGRRG